jgi:3-methyladenine DNA glycosylase/8-oxoguanine DNA glycosylase
MERRAGMNVYSFEIDVDDPFDFGLTVKKPAGWHWSTPFEVLDDRVFWTALRLSGCGLIGLRLTASEGGVKGEAFSRRKLDDKGQEELIGRVRLGLGVEDYLEGFYALADQDPLIRRLKDDLFGMRLGFLSDVFERALLTICLQMAPMKRSNQMMKCLIQCYGEEVRFDGRKVQHWPAAKLISGTGVEEMRKRCNLGYRAEPIRRVAAAIVGGFPSVLELRRMSAEEAAKALKGLYGVGIYSAQIISPHYGFPLDVWSARIFYEILFGETPAEPRKAIGKIEAEAERRWGRYRWHVFVYVLNDLSNLSKHYRITKPV